MKLKNIKIQFYLGANVREKDKLALIILAVFVKATKEGICGDSKFKELCNNIGGIMSQCGANGITKEIKEKIRNQKKNYPFITPSIYGDNGSKMAGYRFNGVASFDADVADNPALLDVEYRNKMKHKLMDLPNMFYVATSPSGGLKMLMFLTIYRTDSEYKQMYPVVQKYIEIKSGLTLDKATSAPNQNMFIPFDPDVLFDDDKFLLNREELMALIAETVQLPESTVHRASRTHHQQVPISDDVAENLVKVEWYVNQFLDKNIDATAAYGDYIGLCFSFSSLGEDARGLWLKLCSLYNNYKPEECDAKFTHCLEKHDGRRNIGSFFWECENRYRLLPYRNINTSYQDNRSPLGSSTNSSNILAAKIDHEEDTDNNLFLCPYLFSGLENELPKLIKDVILQYPNPRQRDIVGLTMINSISGLFSNVKIAHFNKIRHVNLSAIIVAPPASGKGVLTDVRKIFSELDEFIYQQSLKERLEWDAEEEGNKPLEAPLIRYYLIPLDSTNAAFLNFLLASSGVGAIIETEMGVANTIGKQWESIKSILLKNPENEDYDVNRKGAGLKRVQLRFGLTVSTTPHSAINMISAEDGLGSRIIMYCFNECMDIDDDTFNYERAYESKDFIEKIGTYIRSMYETVSKSPDIVYGWPKNNRAKLLEFFHATRERSLKVFGKDFDQYVKRTLLIASRLGGIFSFLDDYENNNLAYDHNVPIRMISDKYVDIIITIVNRILWHSRTFYDNLEKSPKVIDSKNNKIYHILRFLPSEFKLQDLDKAFLDKVQISQKTLERRINDCCEHGFLEKIKHGHYRKTDKCPNK